MESSSVKGRSGVISIKSNSVDNQKFSSAGSSEEALKKGNIVVGDDDAKKANKRKSRKDLDLNSPVEPKAKKSRNSSVDGVSSGSVKSDGPVLESGQNSNRSGGLSGFSFSLGGFGDSIQIPKKPRGSVGIRSHVPNSVGSSSSGDQTAQLNSDQRDRAVDEPSLSQHSKKGKERLGERGNSVEQAVNLKSDGKDRKIAMPSVGQKDKIRSDNGSLVDKVSKSSTDPKDHKNRREKLTIDENSIHQIGKMKSVLKDPIDVPKLPLHPKKRRELLIVDEGSPLEQPGKLNLDCKDRNLTVPVPNIPQHENRGIEQSDIDKGNSVDEIAVMNSDSKDCTSSILAIPKNAKRRRNPVIISEGNVGGTSCTKGQGHANKRKGLAVDSSDLAEKAPSAADYMESFFEELDGEENLLQNAAMMLSSRFDPRCTGPSRSRSSLSHSGGDTGSQIEYLQASSECRSPDNASRTQRSNYNHNEKGLPRKRRHFYEVVYMDKDARWYLNRRIKVFWPLDERWYHGLVNDYDEERKLHHVNYDDKDEEWISLQHERFMLLLLRSEVTDMEKPLQSSTHDKLIKKGKKAATSSKADPNCGSHMESAPIISWLPRSSNQAKSFSSVKKQKTDHQSPSDLLPSSGNFTNAHPNSVVGLLEKDPSEACFSDSADWLVYEANGGEMMSDHPTSLKENGLPTVYVRRRFHKKKDESVCMSVDNSRLRSLPISSMSAADRISLDKENLLSDCWCPEELILSISSDGILKLNLAWIQSREFVTHISLPVRTVLDFPFGSEVSRFSRLSLLLKYGSIVTTWPKVYFEMLFVDNKVGLRFFLLEGCLMQAVNFLFIVLSVFCGATKLRESVDFQIPATSIRFKLSCIQDLKKQHVFSFYSFCELKHSNWLYLDSVFQEHCLFAKKLPLTECTLENIKALESGSKQIHINSVSWESSFQGTRRKSFQDIIPIGLSKSGKENRRQSPIHNVKHGMLPFTLSFNAAPHLFRSLHLKMLMESSIACVRLKECTLACSLECRGNTCKSTTSDWAVAKHFSEISSHVVPQNTPGTLSDEQHFGCLSSTNPQMETHPLTASMNSGRIISSLHCEDGNLVAARTYTCSKDGGSTENDVITHSLLGFNNSQQERLLTSTNMTSYNDQVSPVISGDGGCHNVSSMSVDIPEIDLIKSSIDGKLPGVHRASNFISTMSDGIVLSPDTVTPKNRWTSNTRNLSSSPLGEMSPVWPAESTNAMQSGFGNGPRKPRTQVHYAMPLGGSECSSRYKPLNQHGNSFRRFRRPSEKKTPDDSKGSQRNLELLACDSNVLITLGDRCWREFGAQVALELADHNEWRLAVKFSGSTKYSHKVHNVFAPGSTNRYTHAMMWKGGKDWALEFPDRGQWTLFKEMYEECYNRNIRAASVKNIPIPGVRLVEECEVNTEKLPFTRSPRYFRQIETDIEMAMNPSKILYDMDTEDEQWISRNVKSFQTQDNCCVVITDGLFEKTMDMLEKFAYDQQRDHFTVAEIEKLSVEIVPMDVIKSIYQHWLQKRRRNGMPLIRHLQPPLWDRYQQKMQEWSQLMSKANTTTAGGGNGKTPHVEKPAMFAFCLKPRGLEVPNKGSKHRSQKKYHVTGHSHALIGDQDGVHTLGRRSNSFALRDEKAAYPDYSPENSDTSASKRIYSPSDACTHEYMSMNTDASDLSNHPKLYKNKSKKIGALMPRSNLHTPPSYNQRTLGKRNGVQRRDMESPDWPSQKPHQTEVYTKHGTVQIGTRDLDEFRMRDAAGAAKHAANIAMIKREKAQRMFSIADHALQVAVSAVMTADAVKASYPQTNE